MNLWEPLCNPVLVHIVTPKHCRLHALTHWVRLMALNPD